MNVKELALLQSIQPINNVDCACFIESVYIGDVLSIVMANGKPGSLWITTQISMNAIAVASLQYFAAILFVQSRIPDIDVIQKATALNIPLFYCTQDAYQIAGVLIENGL